MNNLLKTTIGLLLLLFLAACDDNEALTSTIVVKLTDAPADYQEVNIDIQEVQVNLDEDENESGWTSLSGINPGIYNLLDLTNGLDTLLAEGEVPAGFISQIRLVLGPNNSLVIDNQAIDLRTPSAQQSGLKVNLKQELNAGITYTVLLDFDAARSVVQAGNSGNYNLKPVIKAIAEAIDGSISGSLLPAETSAVVYAIQASDTLGSSFTDDTGGFLVRGLDAGNYDLHIHPQEPFQPLILEGVLVEIGQVTDIGMVTVVP